MSVGLELNLGLGVSSSPPFPPPPVPTCEAVVCSQCQLLFPGENEQFLLSGAEGQGHYDMFQML